VTAFLRPAVDRSPGQIDEKAQSAQLAGEGGVVQVGNLDLGAMFGDEQQVGRFRLLQEALQQRLRRLRVGVGREQRVLQLEDSRVAPRKHHRLRARFDPSNLLARRFGDDVVEHAVGHVGRLLEVVVQGTSDGPAGRDHGDLVADQRKDRVLARCDVGRLRSARGEQTRDTEQERGALPENY
jgi:hypothetical protein